MAKEGTHIWNGGDGKEYDFNIWPNTQVFNHMQGNYIFAKKNRNGDWEAIYIGEGYLDDRTQDEKHLKCANQKGFTHYHTHRNEDENVRKEEEENLIEGNPECLDENGGCNETSDG